MLVVLKIAVVLCIINTGIRLALYVSDSDNKARSNQVLYSIALLLVMIVLMNIEQAIG